MHNSENPDLVLDNLKNHSVVANSELLVSFESASQRLSITLRPCRKPRFDGPREAASQVLADGGNIFGLNIGMVNEAVRHPRLSISGAPHLLMRQCASAFEALLSLLGKAGQSGVFLCL